MPIVATSHIAIGVSDLDQSLRFYRDLLGLHVSRLQEEDVPNLQDADRSSKRRAAYLRWREGDHETFIVLDEQLEGQHGEPAKFLQRGVHHVGLWVEDLDSMHERLVNAGVRVMFAPAPVDTERYGEEPGRQCKAAFYYDPDGTIIQLDQRMPG